MHALPSELDSPRTKLVYHYLLTTEGATPEELRTSLDLPLLSVLPTLEHLRERSLIERHNGRYVPIADG